MRTRRPSELLGRGAPSKAGSPGFVWEDAVRGFEAVGLPQCAGILRAASQRLGGAARECSERRAQLDRHEVDFQDLDEQFFEIDRADEIDRKMLEFAGRHAKDFYFQGTVTRAVFPVRGARVPPSH